MKIIKSKTIDIIVNNKLISRLMIYYNKQGLEVCRINSDGFRLDREYNKQGQEIYYKDSTGLEYSKYYNEAGLEIKCEYKDNSGYIKEYNKQGLEISYVHTCGAYEYKKYDEQGRIILREDHLGNEYVYEYNFVGRSYEKYNCTMINKNSGYTEYSIYDDNDILRSLNKNKQVDYSYDEQGRIILEIKDGDFKRYWKYKDDKIECYKKIDGETAILEYASYLNEKGKEIKTVYNDKTIEFKYNDKGHLIYTKITDINADIGITTCDIEYY